MTELKIGPSLMKFFNISLETYSVKTTKSRMEKILKSISITNIYSCRLLASFLAEIEPTINEFSVALNIWLGSGITVSSKHEVKFIQAC